MHTGLAFAWNIAAPYLIIIKVRAQHAKAYPGVPIRLVSSSVLHRVLGAGKMRRRLQDATDIDADDHLREEGGGERGGGEAQADEDFISTPWSRCAE